MRTWLFSAMLCCESSLKSKCEQGRNHLPIESRPFEAFWITAWSNAVVLLWISNENSGGYNIVEEQIKIAKATQKSPAFLAVRIREDDSFNS
jgi:hypothetical protein